MGIDDQSAAEAVFFAALERATAAERAAYLDGACGGDGALRRRVEALLAAHPHAGRFLERPVTEAEVIAALGGVEGPPENARADLSFLAPPLGPDSLGRIGHYEVLEVLGRGGFGTVLRAFDDKLHRVVAIKVLAPELAATSPARKRFLREARSAAMVRHENVVQVYAVEEQPLPYLAMEFIPGETLQQRLDRTGPLEAAEAVEIGRQIAEGLAAAHATGLVHRDIKPANILIESGGVGGTDPRVKITDFGVARAADDASLTHSGYFAGTPMYMAPEQASGEALDHRADLFSLGSVLYAMCTGRPPFRANGTLAVLKRVAEDTPRPIPQIIPEAPQWLCDVIARLHAKDPRERFSTAREVADRLAAPPSSTRHRRAPLPKVGADPAPQEFPARPPAGALPAAPAPGSRTRRWATAAAVVFLLGAGLGFTESAGVTDVRGTVVRLFSPQGTVIVEVDDPAVSVQLDGSDLVIAGAGPKEIRLKPGAYTLEARKGGELVSRERVSVARGGRQVVRVSREAPPRDLQAAGRPADAAWERSVATMPAEEQVAAVAAKLRERNRGFDGIVKPTIEGGVVTGLEFHSNFVSNTSPLHALTGLRSLNCSGTNVSDLTPVADMKLEYLDCQFTHVADLTPLRGMPLTYLNCGGTDVSDLSPLKGMPLENLILSGAPVSDLSPLRGMPLTLLGCSSTNVTDLSPLKDLPRLAVLWCNETAVYDLTPLKDARHLSAVEIMDTRVTDPSPLRAIPALTSINAEPAAKFWNGVDAKTGDQ
jgi:hypothetical protein